eukprot:GDKJ01047512.1.p1 GENE.GDKJ01047512.1~~GDKJ01047512.1.p1  ORF type:complete len:547 (-),score=156.15 GDKJ01047512.1:144-1601(-)
MKQAFPSESSVQRVWGSFTGVYGEVSNFEFAQEEGDNVVFNAETDNHKITFIVSLDSDGSSVNSFEIFNEGLINEMDNFPPYSSEEAVKELNINFGRRDWRLSATITLPSFASPENPCRAIVVCINDFGPSDRHNTVGATAPFRDIAYGLAARGIATFRFDKRTLTYADRCQQSFASFTPEFEIVEDAISAIRQVSDVDFIAKKSVFVLGLGQGSYLTPRIIRAFRAAEANEKKQASDMNMNDSPIISTSNSANPFVNLAKKDEKKETQPPSAVSSDPLDGSKDSSIRGAILLSAPAFPLYANKTAQLKHVAKCLTKDDPSIAEQVSALIQESEAQERNVHLLLQNEQVDASAGFPFSYPSVYWTSLANYDPCRTMAGLSPAVPALLIQGSRDYCATQAEDFQKWTSDMNEKTPENPNFDAVIFPKLSALLVPPTAELQASDVDGLAHPSEVHNTKGHVAQEVVDKIAMWINQKVEAQAASTQKK